MLEIFIVLIGGTYWLLRLLGEHIDKTNSDRERKKRCEIQDSYRKAIQYERPLETVEKLFTNKEFALDFVTKVEDDLVYIIGREEYDNFVKEIDDKYDFYCKYNWSFAKPKFLEKYATLYLYLAYKGKMPWTFFTSGICVYGYYDSSKTTRLAHRVEDILNKRYNGKIKFVFTRYTTEELSPTALYGGYYALDCFTINSIRIW